MVDWEQLGEESQTEEEVFLPSTRRNLKPCKTMERLEVGVSPSEDELLFIGVPKLSILLLFDGDEGCRRGLKNERMGLWDDCDKEGDDEKSRLSYVAATGWNMARREDLTMARRYFS